MTNFPIQVPPGMQAIQNPDGSYAVIPIQQQVPQLYGAPPGYAQVQQQQHQTPPPMPQGFAPPGHQYPPAQASSAPPNVYYPSAEEHAQMVMRAQAEQARVANERAGRGSRTKAKYVKFLGANGDKRWTNTPIGFRRTLLLRILPSGVQGQNYFLEAGKHFLGYIKGSGWCAGPGCRICAAVKAAFDSGQDEAWKKANKAKAKAARLYQVIQYGELAQGPQGAQLQNLSVDLHRDESGQVRPLLYEVGSDLHARFNEISMKIGIHALLDLERGMPIAVTKAKKGALEQNVDFTADDMPNFAGPLPREFSFGPRGEGLMLLDLSEFARPAKPEDQARMVSELKLDQTGQQYSYAPDTPSQPYQAQPQVHAQGYPTQGYGQQPAHYQAAPGGQPAWTPAQALPQVVPYQPPAPQPPPVLPQAQGSPASYPAPRALPDPWAEPQEQQQAWTPPAPPPFAGTPSSGTPFAGPPAPVVVAPSPELEELTRQLMGQSQPPAVQQGHGPAFPAPPVSAPPKK